MIIAQIENAIIERLKAASGQNVLGYTLKAVDTLPTDLDDRLNEYIQNFPAAWVVFGGWRELDQLGDGETIVEATFHVIVGAASLRNEERFQRHGDGVGGIGSYQLALDVVGLLLTQSFGLPMSGLGLGACTPLYSGQTQAKRKCSLFGVKFTTRFGIDPSMPDQLMTPAIGDFATFAVGWDVPPHTGEPDHSDLILLPQETQDDG